MSALVLSWIVAATLKGSLVIALAMLVRGRLGARWMHALLLIAVVRLLMPVAPESSFSIFNLAPQPELAARAPVMYEAPLPAPPAPAPATIEVAPPEPRLDRMTIALIVFWAIGCAFVLLRAIVRVRGLHRRLRDRVEIDLPLVDECRAIMGVRRRVRAFETEAVSTPSLHGLVRPVLLLPRGFIGSFSRDEVRFVILHELAHLRRADILVNWLTTFAQALHWFNPLVHLAAARLAEERELACDALALERLRDDERRAYGGTVLAVLDRMRQPSPAPGLVGMTATHRQLKRRIMMIAAYRPRRRSSLIFAAAVAVVALASLTDAVAGDRVTFHRRLPGELSPAADAVMRQLQGTVSGTLTKAGIEEIASLISARTGVSISFAEGVLDEKARATTFTLNATDVPGHIILTETVDSLDLAVRFTETGAVVERIPEDALRREPFIRRAPMPAPTGEGLRETVQFERALPPDAAGGDERDVIFFERHTPGEAGAIEPRMKMFHKESSVEDGGFRRKVTFRGGREGQADGTLELEVHREATSSSR